MIDLEELLASGKLAEVARGCKTQKELAGKLGLSADAYELRIRRIRKRGGTFPTLLELLGVVTAEPQPRPQWSNLAAFDAEEAHRMAPDGYHVKGVSTLYGPDGEMLKWVKTSQDKQDRYDALMKAMSSIAEDWKGLADPAPRPEMSDEDLLCVYPMGDPHLGMLSWSEETGHNHDLTIAEHNLIAAADRLVAIAPAAKTAIVANLGDFFHVDGKAGTTTNGTKQDVDSRWPKVLRAGVRVMRRIIDQALTKHETVRVISEIGNHDDHTSIMLATCLAQFYEREPRVEVDDSPRNMHWYRFGKNLIVTTHSDKLKGERFHQAVTYDLAKEWGETIYRYGYLGHVHHDSEKEIAGLILMTMRTLAPQDDWHMKMGYRAGQDMKVDVIHREFGRINRHIVGIDQIRTRAA